MVEDARWPNLFVVGTIKGGTTSLHRYLDQHPEVFMSPEKEPHYFDRLSGKDGAEREAFTEWYLSLFDEAGDVPVLGETTTTYLPDEDAPELVRERVPDAKILASLRDPITRAYSHYWMHVAAGTQPASFGEAIREEMETGSSGRGADHWYLPQAHYGEHVGRWIDALGRDQVHVHLLADMKEDAEGALRDILSFLEVDPGGVETMDLGERHNTFKGVPYGGVAEWLRSSPVVKTVAPAILPKRVRDFIGNRVLLREQDEKPPIPDDVRETLAEYFEPHVAELEEVLDRDLPELRASWP